MYKEHALFDPPPTEATLWRYMDLSKFISLLEARALFFARADKLGDPFEGSYAKSNQALRPIIYKDQIPPERLAAMSSFYRESRRFTLINCWHENDSESEAMWRLYSREREGIAIKTTFQRLRDSFTTDETIFIGKVNYVDYQTHFTREDNTMGAYLDKRKSFEHEREVRAVVQNFPSRDGALDLSTDICDVGISFEIDIDLLVLEVVIDARADDWFLELIAAIAARYDLNAPVTRSVLAEEPSF